MRILGTFISGEHFLQHLQVLIITGRYESIKQKQFSYWVVVVAVVVARGGLSWLM